jgi:hypothetical protein
MAAPAGRSPEPWLSPNSSLATIGMPAVGEYTRAVMVAVLGVVGTVGTGTQAPAQGSPPLRTTFSALPLPPAGASSMLATVPPKTFSVGGVLSSKLTSSVPAGLVGRVSKACAALAAAVLSLSARSRNLPAATLTFRVPVLSAAGVTASV